MKSVKLSLFTRLAEHFTAGREPVIVDLVKPTGGGGERLSPFTMVGLEGGKAGLAWNLLVTPEDRVAYDALQPEAVSGRSALDLARGYLDGDQVERIVGYAACHALSQILLEDRDAHQPAGDDLVSLAAPESRDHIGVVGFSPPLVRALAAKAGRVTVLEARDRSTSLERVAITKDAQDLAACDKVLITSTSLLNESFAELERITRGAGYRALYGPGAGILPELFFDLGFDAVGGMLVLDGELLMERQRSGQKWGDAKLKCVFKKQQGPRGGPR